MDLEILCLTFGGDSLLVWSHSNDGWKKVDDCKIFENSYFLHKCLLAGSLVVIGQCLDNNQILREGGGGPTFIVSARVFLGRQPLLARGRIVLANRPKTGGFPLFSSLSSSLSLSSKLVTIYICVTNEKSPLSSRGRFLCPSSQVGWHTCR